MNKIQKWREIARLIDYTSNLEPDKRIQEVVNKTFKELDMGFFLLKTKIEEKHRWPNGKSG